MLTAEGSLAPGSCSKVSALTSDSTVDTYANVAAGNDMNFNSESTVLRNTPNLFHFFRVCYLNRIDAKNPL